MWKSSTLRRRSLAFQQIKATQPTLSQMMKWLNIRDKNELCELLKRNDLVGKHVRACFLHLKDWYQRNSAIAHITSLKELMALEDAAFGPPTNTPNPTEITFQIIDSREELDTKK